MISNGGVNTKTALAGRKAVVAPLSGEHGYELSACAKPVEHLSRRSPGESQKWRAQSRAEDSANERGQSFFREEPTEGAACMDLLTTGAAIRRELRDLHHQHEALERRPFDMGEHEEHHFRLHAFRDKIRAYRARLRADP